MKPLDPDCRRIIEDASRADVPAGDAEARIWQSLEAQLSRPLPPTARAAQEALAAAASKSPLLGLGLKLTLGVTSLGALALLATLVAQPATSGVPAAAPRRPAASTTVPAPPAVTVEPLAAQQEPSSVVPSSSLLEETRLLASAQRQLRHGAPGRALRLLELHARRFSRGILEQEREAARVLALCALGRHQDARGARHDFLQRWPGSPMVARLRPDCAVP